MSSERVNWPPSLRRVTPLEKRSSPLLGFGLEHAPFVAMYGAALKHCFDTAGEPHAAAMAHIASLKEDPSSLIPEEGDIFSEKIDIDDIPVPHEYMPNFWSLLFVVVVLLAHVFLFFLQRWWIKSRALVKYRVPGDRQYRVGGYALVEPLAHQGVPLIIQIEEAADWSDRMTFKYQRQVFEIETESDGSQMIVPLRYPLDLTLDEYVNSEGLRSEALTQSAKAKYGPNNVNVPQPTFMGVFRKQILGPVPVFQMFCTMLWLLDEYWNYAFFSLAMILMFEASTAFGRVKSVTTLGTMKTKPSSVFIYREKWLKMSSEDLLPGDIFSLSQVAGGGDDDTASGTDAPAPDQASDGAVPCDALILSGQAVCNEATLTGESTPMMKEAIHVDSSVGAHALDIESDHRTHTLYSGTSLMQVTPAEGGGAVAKISAPPDGGCVCYCLRTGFASSQGKLLQMIEYSSEQVSGDKKETLALFTVLLLFALCSSGYVLRKGLLEGKRTQYELVLRCVLILTSVVPPELPMQAAVAVNTALMSLWKAQVFCTEPFRIPYAGKVSIALFDKTGTLTTDQLVTAGCVPFASSSSSSPETSEPKPLERKLTQFGIDATLVLATCHSLVDVRGNLVGDPIETAALKQLPYTYTPKDQTARPKDDDATIRPSGRVLHRYHFMSALQRMSSLVRVTGGGSGGSHVRIMVKGSPEAVALLCDNVPPSFKETYRSLAENGMRILALAHRRLSEDEEKSLGSNGSARWPAREDVESGLTFLGFIAFNCPVRRDSAKVVRELKAGSIRVIMVTGDAALTALYIAGQVSISPLKDSEEAHGRPALLLKPGEDENEAPVWTRAHRSDGGGDDETIPFVAKEVPALAVKYHLVMTGKGLASAANADAGVWNVVEYVDVYARMTPNDKERVIRALKHRGKHVLMCGDGANDVGALKQAHVGLALLSGFGSANTAGAEGKQAHEESEAERKSRLAVAAVKRQERQKAMAEDMKNDKAELAALQKQYFQEEYERLDAEGASFASFKAVKAAIARVMEERKRRMKERQKKFGVAGVGSGIAAQAAFIASDMGNDGGNMTEVPIVKLGDASVAAPFTSKLPSIHSTVDIIRQGCCTLVGTIQNMQILALNCIIAAYSLAALFLDNVRFGEAQLIASGMLLSIAGLSYSYSRPVQQLSSVRPIASIFHPAISISTLGQAAIHLACMVYAVQLTQAAQTGDETVPTAFDIGSFWKEVFAQASSESPKRPFVPSLLNTVVFLVETTQQVSVMAVNYKGRPFMLAMTENTAMMWSLFTCCCITFVCAFEVFPEFNGLLRLVSLPSDDFRYRILAVMAVSVFGSFLWDRLITLIFAPRLVFAGYRDAWNALPEAKELMRSVMIAAYWVVVLGLASTGMGILALGAGWYLFRKIFPKPPPKVNEYPSLSGPQCTLM
eukprot:TRINITY_DN7027_c0_g1_i1.p1 TRINITY_DN7027_c0_g1~~TRINITY_DN7027_c0_g1_i1.p1  ORF type:complete len:1422 (+),score=337.42 TRINITY_DN7027_c0_g1_i1:106-4371(+)